MHKKVDAKIFMSFNLNSVLAKNRMNYLKEKQNFTILSLFEQGSF